MKNPPTNPEAPLFHDVSSCQRLHRQPIVPDMTQPQKAEYRSVAADMIARWLKQDVYPEELTAGITRDRALVMEMAYGVVRRRRTLEWLSRCMARHEPEPEVRAYLWLGLYQLVWMRGIADHAAVHETVEACKRTCGRKASRFINALLRRYLREKSTLLRDLVQQPAGVRFSHPDLLVRRWTETFGQHDMRRLCRWNNRPPDVAIRLDLTRTQLADFIRKLADFGIAVRSSPAWPRNCIHLPRGVRVTDVPGFDQGLFTVQDAATCLAVDLLDPQPGESVWDACAAPGGKTLQLAEAMTGRGSLVASDVQVGRLPRLRENLARAGRAWVEVRQVDATDPTPALAPMSQDKILLDVPCSNTGVLRRRPDARWRFNHQRLDKIRAIQARILVGADQALKPGGCLVYSTCSLEPEENSEQIRCWLDAHPNYRLEQKRWLFPPDSGTDGAYAARLRKG